MSGKALKPKAVKRATMRKDQFISYVIMTAPGFLLYCVFLITPILMGIYYSLTDYEGIGTKYNFIGIDN